MVESGFTSNLIQAGCHLITTQVVYLIDPRRSGFQQHENVRSEDKTSLNEQDIPRLTDLYPQLYIGKHCWHNAQFNEAFFALMLATSLIRATLFREPVTGRLDAFSIYMDDGSYLSGCQIGYDLGLPRKARPLQDGPDGPGVAGGAERATGQPERRSRCLQAPARRRAGARIRRDLRRSPTSAPSPSLADLESRGSDVRQWHSPLRAHG